MSARPEAVICRWFEEVWNQGCEASIEEILAADALAHGLPGGTMQGPDAFRPLFRAFRAAFPDLRIEVERTVTEGDMVAAYCRVTGTHAGELMGVAATGRAVDFNGVTLVRVADGMVREGWNCYDFMAMYQQLGVMPALAGA